MRQINLTNTQQNYKVLHTRGCTSRRINLAALQSTRGRVHPWQEPWTPSSAAGPFPSLKPATQTWSPHSWALQCRKRSVMTSPMTLYHSLSPIPNTLYRCIRLCIKNQCAWSGRVYLFLGPEEYLEIFLERYCRYRYRTRYWWNIPWVTMTETHI